MRKLPGIVIIFFLLGTAGPANADYELLVKSNCLACHYLDKRKYGTKLNEVAPKYINEINAVEILAKKIRLVDLVCGAKM